MESLRTYLTQTGQSQREFARLVDVSDATVCRWLAGQNLPTPRRAMQIEAAHGIPRHVLRPDLWDAPTPAAQDAA